ncbi:MAG: glutathione S-transferase [Deltaproteobacteria bacterium]|nr:glutathione S-transferase [Deltaproteobacteria bacterium]MBW2413251.1 glutathione S-transferase [Deltaproteobacteria bacterium]
MKLYTYAGAPNPRRVHIYLAEKGIEIPFEHTDIMKRENRTPEFIEKVNVMGGLPVLELDDGSHIAESISICRYFEAQQPEPSLFGRTPKEQGVTDMWLRRIELNLMTPVGMVWIHGSPLTRAVNPNQIAEVADQNRKIVERYFGFLDDQLASREFIAGGAYSIADITALCTLDFAAALLELAHSPDQKNLTRWHQSVSARPSASA